MAYNESPIFGNTVPDLGLLGLVVGDVSQRRDIRYAQAEKIGVDFDDGSRTAVSLRASDRGPEAINVNAPGQPLVVI